MLANNQKQPKLAVPTKHGTIFVEEEEILFCKASGSYTNIYLENKSMLIIAKSLRKVHEAFPLGIFIRIHNSHIVNSHHIVGYSMNGQSSVTLTDGTILSVSRNRKKSFFEQYRII